MSAPTPAPGDDRPREGYYPDPSIPGYVRYWNGSAWVPGTSRPAPTDGEPLAPPPGARPAQPVAPSVEETGPHFFDEDPQPQPTAEGQHGTPAKPASAWGADRSRQSGFGEGNRVSWGTPAQGADPRVPAQSPAPAEPVADGASSAPGTVVFRRPAAARGDRDEGTMLFGPAASPGQGDPGGTGAAGTGFGTQGPVRAASAGAPQAGPGASPAASGPGFTAGKAAADRAAAAQSQDRAPAQGAAAATGPAPSGAYGAGAPAGQPGGAAPRASATTVPGVPPQAGAPAPAADPVAGVAAAPVTSGAGGGQASWAQQVHRLAEAREQEQPAAPWKPPVDDPFLAAARRQAAVRPAGLGRRLAARLVDTLVLAAVTSAAAVPLGLRTIDHVNEKIDAAELSGHTVTVWIVDGTTSVYLGIVLAVLLVVGALYEALPTARWGRTLGKKLLGLRVQDIEGHEPPSFGPALRRWLVYSVPGLLGIGVVGVAWCLFDRPWHQCWHDKAAHTFVAG
ncbi:MULTISPECIES: RDD family protein [unclassified Streptomyces]|uniref:RDD family protein n=1 Tax=unclassified Streptomyces TaxID=2593676 RepID=UPI001F04BFDD|nr:MULTISPECIES: RDD family protein [unclassified Streptomyces]MCH0563810.1 RDD family protein [Streptomyces sp. MUM 2J]MCH0570096.1 RDD family protein [Streptomyces sp. MUM 136J]